jgi:hypothetical protein
VVKKWIFAAALVGVASVTLLLWYGAKMGAAFPVGCETQKISEESHDGVFVSIWGELCDATTRDTYLVVLTNAESTSPNKDSVVYKSPGRPKEVAWSRNGLKLVILSWSPGEVVRSRIDVNQTTIDIVETVVPGDR